MDDELFLADSSPSKPAESSSFSGQMKSYANLFCTSSSKSRTVAFHMIRNAVKKILFKFQTHLKYQKSKYLIRWKHRRPSQHLYTLNDSKLKSLLYTLSSFHKQSLKKSISAWSTSTRLKSIQRKYDSNKARREDSHSQQKAQLNKALTQILNKQTELEKSISALAAKEKGYKEAIDELNRLPPQDNTELLRQEALLRELEAENQMLRDKLEAVENNVAGFIKEMSELLEGDEERFAPSDDDGFGDSQGKVIRKKRSNILR